jgi:hypothetical protein
LLTGSAVTVVRDDAAPGEGGVVIRGERIRRKGSPEEEDVSRRQDEEDVAPGRSPVRR